MTKKMYWRTREGKSPPREATFSLCPFASTQGTRLTPLTRVEHLPSPTPPIRVMRRSFLPDRPQWVEGVSRALEAIGKQELSKVVLARCCVLECAEAPDPFAVVAALQERAQNATLFCLAEGERAFLGATPERLFLRSGREVVSEAIAGTRRKEAPEEELLNSEKDRSEVEFVQRYLQAKLGPFCAKTAVSPLTIHKTQNVQHLYSQIKGTLKEVSDGALLEALHPTPALCGVPTPQALLWIHKLEPFRRGLYGGVLGWSTPDASEHVVAIRCCEIQGHTVRLYTGAGIVAGSDPEKEWEELDVKMKLYEGIFS